MIVNTPILHGVGILGWGDFELPLSLFLSGLGTQNYLECLFLRNV